MALRFKKYEVTLRRDVQQKAVVRVEASSSQDAIDTAEAAVTEAEDAWQVEEFIGTHRPKIESASKADTALDRKQRRLVGRRAG